MTMPKSVIYKECVVIDGREYMVLNCDYSDSINEALADGVIEEESQAIIDYITYDIDNP